MSLGVKAGVVVEMDAAEAAIGLAVQAAEDEAGERLTSVVVSLGGGKPTTAITDGETRVSSGKVSIGDVGRAALAALGDPPGPDTTLLHAFPVSYSLDGDTGISSPLGMAGTRLRLSACKLGVSTAARLNLGNAVSRLHLTAETVVAQGYAAGLGVLLDDEPDLGVTLIEMGAGTTTAAVFERGALAHLVVVPVGGNHVTSDIAKGLETSLKDAERLKTLHANAVSSPMDERDLIDLQKAAGDGPEQIPKSALNAIVRPRLDEILELVQERMQRAGRTRASAGRIVLSGGASQMPGLKELAQIVLGKQVRSARPIRLQGLPDRFSGPAFSTAIGLLVHAVQPQDDVVALARQADAGGGFMGFLKRLLSA